MTGGITYRELLRQFEMSPPSGRFREWPQLRPTLEWAGRMVEAAERAVESDYGMDHGDPVYQALVVLGRLLEERP